MGSFSMAETTGDMISESGGSTGLLRRRIAFAVMLVAALLNTHAAVANPTLMLDTVDATLSDSSGKDIQISAFRGKPTLLFYEDRTSRELNRKVKDELWKRGREAGMVEAANVIGIANLEAYDFWPARGFARSAVRDVEKKVGVKVLIDWKGTLTTTPWNLPQKSSTIVLLDKEGAVRYSYSGAMSDKDMTELFEKLAALLDLPASAAKTPAPK